MTVYPETASQDQHVAQLWIDHGRNFYYRSANGASPGSVGLQAILSLSLKRASEGAGSGSRANMRTASSIGWTASRRSSPTGTSTCGRRTRNRCCRLNLEGLTPEIMERRRDEVLNIIRG